MRKLFITLALGVAMMSITSCRWIHETLYSVEGCTEWYLNEFYEAAADDDVKTFLERWDQLQQWKKTLSETDVKKLTRHTTTGVIKMKQKTAILKIG